MNCPSVIGEYLDDENERIPEPWGSGVRIAVSPTPTYERSAWRSRTISIGTYGTPLLILSLQDSVRIKVIINKKRNNFEGTVFIGLFYSTKLSKLYFRRIFVLLLFSLFISAPLQSQTGQAGRAIRKQEKAEKSLQKDYDKSRKAALKHRYQIQTPEVKERMKASRKKVDQHYKQKNKPVLKDLFKRKKRRK
jgi:hypothetical protein